ncbi:hypothetical protein RFM26_23265 [Mesorhizobium sp. VK23B]|uniref:Uncharacterized protein n=1 Tax=Mesorhizobium dulcispinae TaxID=3072316 RepID=A0ABU4XJU1_9HYPH|nr:MULTISPECIES: hypothetical protein [unclassified Mesorhizobium]MDX8468629.1 hypothetical protein [Mesorhizobium sp. VK23B]MDX8475030.1 hypothetical protein [Mesorhizobium sp. VK23A]MDX8520408.1 hypothetical protein [Mesorhizobium sp. VK23D]
MRQRMLNGWLVAALVALTCLLGITAYMEVKKDLPRVARADNQTPVDTRAAWLDPRTILCCSSTSRSA